MNKTPSTHGFFRGALASSLAAVVLCLSLLSSSPALHKLLHTDAGTAEHHCVITLFAKGQLASADSVATVVAAFLLLASAVLLGETFVLPLANYRFSASRAPPVLCSLLG